MFDLQLSRSRLQIKLDYLGRTGADKEQPINAGATCNQFAHHAIKLLMAIRHSSEISFSQDGGRKSRLRKDHHARRRLNEVRTST